MYLYTIHLNDEVYHEMQKDEEMISFRQNHTKALHKLYYMISLYKIRNCLV